MTHNVDKHYIFICIILLGLFFSQTADASSNEQEQTTDDNAISQFIFEIDNDAFVPDATDRHLTNVAKLGYISNTLPDLFSWYDDENAEELFALTLTHEIYTPEDVESAEIVEDDRPYAGWLYLTLSLPKIKGNAISMTALDLGIVGPAAGAETVMDAAHTFVPANDVNGWDNQLDNELGINIKHFRGIKSRFEQKNFTTNLTGYIGGSLGTVDTSLTTGASIQFGHNVPKDIVFGYTFDKNRDSFRLYGSADVSGSLVLRDIFLDGNTFSSSHSVDKNTAVGRASIGVTLGIGNFDVVYKYTIITEQFEDQDDPDRIGSIIIKYRF